MLTFIGRMRRRLRALLGRDELHREMDEEIRFHLAREAEELVRTRGLSPEEARRQASIAFGGVDRYKEEGRDARGVRLLEDLAADVRYALRTLARAPAFALIAVATLTLGIGANSALFSVVNGVLLRPLPFEDPERLVQIRTAYPNGKSYSLSAPDFASLRDQSRLWEDASAFASGNITLLAAGEPKELRVTRVTDGFFDLLGVTPQLGRTFGPADHTPGQGRVAVLGHDLWQGEFGGDPAVVGRTLTLGGTAHTVVGVLPRTFPYPASAELYTPIEYDETFSATTPQSRRSEWLRMLARIRPGITSAQVEAELRAIGERLQQEFPATNERLSFTATGLHESVVGDVRTPLLILLAAVGLVLLIACANVANLLLARSASRRREVALRAALGAGRGRLVRQFLTESVVLGLAGGALGLLLGLWGTRALVAARPASLPRLDQIGLDGPVLIFTAAITLGTTLLFGILPALQVVRGGLVNPLKAVGRGGSSAGGRLRSGLVMGEMALAVILLVGAGLLTRSFLELVVVDPGFRAEDAVTLRVSLPPDMYPEASERRTFFSMLDERLESLPGVVAVGGVSALPLRGGADMLGFGIEGRERRAEQVWEIRALSVTPGYFEAMGIPLRRGRLLTEQDRFEAPSVVVINEAAAERWFPGEDPVGEQLVIGEPWEIVGVVDDVKQSALARDVRPELYIPHEQWSTGTLHVVVRAAGEPLALGGAIRREVQRLDPDLPVQQITPLEDVLSESVAQPRFYSTLLGLFAAGALALAAVGLFGVTSYAVAQRTREIGIRVALGARPDHLLRLVVGRAMLLAVGGLLIGLVGAVALTRVLQSQLFGVSALDPLTYGAVAVILAGVAFVAGYVPARSATRVHPIVALRAPE